MEVFEFCTLNESFLMSALYDGLKSAGLQDYSKICMHERSVLCDFCVRRDSYSCNKKGKEE